MGITLEKAKGIEMQWKKHKGGDSYIKDALNRIKKSILECRGRTATYIVEKGILDSVTHIRLRLNN